MSSSYRIYTIQFTLTKIHLRHRFVMDHSARAYPITGVIIWENLTNSSRRTEYLTCSPIPIVPGLMPILNGTNRTVQEEFVDNHLDTIHDKPLLGQELADYLIEQGKGYCRKSA